VDQSSIFAKIASELSVLLSGLETQKAQINSYAQSLAALLNSARDTMPHLESRITAIATELAQAASKNQQTMSKAIEESAAGISRTLEGASKVSSKAAEEYNKQIAQLVAKSKDQIDLLDAALSDELKKSLEALGGHLAALSEKFVSDYLPLTERLREVVRIAEQVK
jgi:ABC-type transporter Mla subunit MlaD